MNNETIIINGFMNRNILCHHITDKDENIAIFFPGYGYGTEAPFFFYLVNILIENNYNVLTVDTRYNEWKDYFKITNNEQCVHFEGNLIYEYLNKKGEYKNYLWIGKSLGTGSIQGFINKVIDNTTHNFIFCTPYKNRDELANILLNINNKSLIIWGTSDDYYENEINEKYKKGKNNKVLLLENIDHGLCSNEGTKATLRIMEIIMEECSDFIRKIMN
jgi:hypothetical protein